MKNTSLPIFGHLASLDAVEEKDELKEVDIDRIAVSPFQPRRNFAQEDLVELSQSIQSIGIIHPPLARLLPDGKMYELISGERRFRAAQMAGLKKIPLLVRNTNNSHAISAQAALIENIQRVDLNPIEIAKALRSLIEQFGCQQEELAVRIGKKRSTVSNYLRLLFLPKSIQDGVSSDLISMGHAKAILSLEGFDKQIFLFELIVRDSLSVRETEEAALRIAEKAKKSKPVYVERDFFLEQIAERMQSQIGTKVTIQGQGKKGKVIIDYYNLDDLDRLIAIFEKIKEPALEGF